MANLTILRSNIAAELGLDNSTSGDQPQIDRFLNNAVIDMLKRTHCYVTSSTSLVAFVNGTGDYTLDPSILAIDEMYVSNSGGQGYWFERIDAHELLKMRLNSTAMSPSRFYATRGANLLLVYPTPTAADQVTTYYVPVPTAMSSGTNDPSNATYGGIPAEYHDGLELFAEWKLGSLDDDASSAQGERYRILYEGQDGRSGYIARMHKDLREKGGRRLPRFLPPSARRRRVLLQPGQTNV